MFLLASCRDIRNCEVVSEVPFKGLAKMFICGGCHLVGDCYEVEPHLVGESLGIAQKNDLIKDCTPEGEGNLFDLDGLGHSV